MELYILAELEEGTGHPKVLDISIDADKLRKRRLPDTRQRIVLGVVELDLTITDIRIIQEIRSGKDSAEAEQEKAPTEPGH